MQELKVKLNLDRGSCRITGPLYLGATLSVSYDREGAWQLLITEPAVELPAEDTKVWAQTNEAGNEISFTRQVLLDRFTQERAREPDGIVMAKVFVLDNDGMTVADGETTIEYSPAMFTVDGKNYPTFEEFVATCSSLCSETESYKDSVEVYADQCHTDFLYCQAMAETVNRCVVGLDKIDTAVEKAEIHVAECRSAVIEIEGKRDSALVAIAEKAKIEKEEIAATTSNIYDTIDEGDDEVRKEMGEFAEMAGTALDRSTIANQRVSSVEANAVFKTQLEDDLVSLFDNLGSEHNMGDYAPSVPGVVGLVRGRCLTTTPEGYPAPIHVLSVGSGWSSDNTPGEWSLMVGSSQAYANSSMAVGDSETQEGADYSVALGDGALAKDKRSFVWTAVYQTESRYSSHGAGTFSINPEGGADGFYIGETPLTQIIAEASAGKRDKTDNTVTADSFSFTAWKFHCDVPEIQAALDANPPTVSINPAPEGKYYWLIKPLPNVSGYGTDAQAMELFSDENVESIIFRNAYYYSDLSSSIPVTATREKHNVAVTGESYVSLTGVASLTENKIPKYDFASAALVTTTTTDAEGNEVTTHTLTLTPYTNAQFTSDGTAFTVRMGGGTTNYLRDCVFVVTAGSTAPTISWGEEGGQKFSPRTDAAADMEIAANTTKVFWISEYAEDKFAVAGWEVPT